MRTVPRAIWRRGGPGGGWKGERLQDIWGQYIWYSCDFAQQHTATHCSCSVLQCVAVYTYGIHVIWHTTPPRAVTMRRYIYMCIYTCNRHTIMRQHLRASASEKQLHCMYMCMYIYMNPPHSRLFESNNVVAARGEREREAKKRVRERRETISPLSPTLFFAWEKRETREMQKRGKREKRKRKWVWAAYDRHFQSCTLVLPYTSGFSCIGKCVYLLITTPRHLHLSVSSVLCVTCVECVKRNLCRDTL